MYRIGIDVGGTFTDCVLASADGALQLTKVATTPEDQSKGVLAGIERLAEIEGLALAHLLRKSSAIIHGTTTADNTMIEMSGAVTGLITSAGHRDEIELRRGFKENIWDPALPPPPPIALRRRRLGVPERLDFEGHVVTPLDEDAVRAALQRLRKLGTESVAVVFLFSFINPQHELRVREIAAAEFPALKIWLSHEIMPSAPEFERTSTTLVNAYVGPRIDAYLSRLISRLRDAGFQRELLLMQSNGGIMPPEYIAKRPICVLSSGPTGGTQAASTVAATAKIEDFVCADMGGTSYDVCLVRGGSPEIKASWNWHHRYVIGLPMVDIQSVGAGGGSIASVDSGILSVGPRSAGAVPGPVCYRRGGEQPTVTDANLVLGYLNADGFCDGTMRLDRVAAERSIDEHVAGPLGISNVEAASGIYRLVNANMANAIRRVSAQRGVDPRQLTMLSYGGNGPIHATAQASELGIAAVLVPKSSPQFSALGLLLSDRIVDESRSHIVPAGRADAAAIRDRFAEMEAEVRAQLRGRGSLRIERYAHLCYPGQTFDLAVPFGTGRRVDAKSIERAVEAFHQLHEELHTYASRDEEPILRSLRVTGRRTTTKPSLPTVRRSAARARRTAQRRAWFGDRWVEAPVYDGTQMRATQSVRGPAMIDEPFSTIVLHPGQRATLGRDGTYRIEL